MDDVSSFLHQYFENLIIKTLGSSEDHCASPQKIRCFELNSENRVVFSGFKPYKSESSFPDNRIVVPIIGCTNVGKTSLIDFFTKPNRGSHDSSTDTNFTDSGRGKF